MVLLHTVLKVDFDQDMTGVVIHVLGDSEEHLGDVI